MEEQRVQGVVVDFSPFFEGEAVHARPVGASRVADDRFLAFDSFLFGVDSHDLSVLDDEAIVGRELRAALAEHYRAGRRDVPESELTEEQREQLESLGYLN